MTTFKFPFKFRDALGFTLKHEGGFVNHPKDPGGMTNLGITKRTLEEWLGHSVTERRMRGLTVNDVSPIYEFKYWKALGCDQMPAGAALALFDFGVNSGTWRATKHMQEIVGAVSDGYIGPKTREALGRWISSNGERAFIEDICASRMAFLRRLSTWRYFGKGWGRRVNACKKAALGAIR